MPRIEGFEKERRFCSMVAEVCAWILARQKVIDRPISRAERMALVLRITRFIGDAHETRLACTLSSLPVRRAMYI